MGGVFRPSCVCDVKSKGCVLNRRERQGQREKGGAMDVIAQ